MLKSILIVSALIVAAVPAAAADTVQQNGQASKARPQKPAKAAEPKICKYLPQGRVCLTAAKWKEYEEMS